MRPDKRGFTLIELLVVIAIIAILMGILLPALGRVRKQAKGVMCQTYLKQWGTIINMYCDDNNRRFPTRGIPSGQGRWMYAMKKYYGDANDLKLCPLVKKSSIASALDSSSWWGSTYTAWEIPPYDAGGGRHVGTYGSYGINGWVYVPYENKPPVGIGQASWQWKTPDVKGASQVPLMLDCEFWCGWPLATNTPRSEPIDKGTAIPDEQGMQRFCLDRHSGRVNCVFMDFHVSPVGLKELWTLKWHRQYNQSGPWTKTGGVRPTDWPNWMHKSRDY